MRNISHAADLALEEGRRKNLNDSAHGKNPSLSQKEDAPIKAPGETALFFFGLHASARAQCTVHRKQAFQCLSEKSAILQMMARTSAMRWLMWTVPCALCAPPAARASYTVSALRL